MCILSLQTIVFSFFFLEMPFYLANKFVFLQGKANFFILERAFRNELVFPSQQCKFLGDKIFQGYLFEWDERERDAVAVC